MRHELFIAGFGGQGVLLAGNLLGYAAMGEGREVTFLPAYGVEKRGGAAMCTVIVADGTIGSPVIGHPASAILFNQAAVDKFLPQVAVGGLCLLNGSLAVPPAALPAGLRLYTMPLNLLAQELGDPRLVNMVAIGAYAALTGIVRVASLVAALSDVLPARNHRYIPANMDALEAGAAWASAHFPPG